jgi:peptide/nickel transport system substrate-binding protein
LSYKTTTNELRRRIAAALAAQLARVGIDLEVLTYEWGTFFADVRSGSFHLYSLEWVGIADPDIYRQVFHSTMIPPNGNNRGRYRDGKIDRWTHRARKELDRERRKRLYARVQRRTAKTLPYIPLWWPARVVVANRRLLDFAPAPSGDLFGLTTARIASSTTPGDAHASER